MLTLTKWTKSYLISVTSLLACSWSSVSTLSDTTADDPFVSVNGNGEAVVAWTAYVNDDLVIQSAYYDGMYWYAHEDVSNGGFNVNPSIKIDEDGNSIAIWERLDTETTFRDIMSAIRPAGDTWQTPEFISLGLTNVFSVLDFNDAGQIVAGWVNQEVDTIQVATQTFGMGWSAPETISGSGGSKGNLQIAIDPAGNCVAAWEEFDSGTIFAAQTSGGFESAWSTPEALSSAGQNTNPSLSIANNGDGVVSWVDGDSYTIFASLYLSGSWESSPTALSPPLSYYSASSALDSGIFVSWLNLDTGQNQSIRYIAGDWESVVDISVDTPNSNPAISGVATSTFNAWTDYLTGQVKANEYGIVGTPSAPVVISVGDVNYGPVLDSSDAITAAAWVSYTGVDVNINASLN